MIELSNGRIRIDGVNVADIGLDVLRHRLSAIPQEALLFNGTMRENLDPECLRTDAELHDVLQRCGLMQLSGQGHDNFNKIKLDAKVADEGSNYS